MTPPAIAAENWTWVSFGLWFYIAAVGTVAAFCCYLRSLDMIPAATASLLASFEPLSAVVLGVLLMGLTLNGAELLGIGLIFVMVVLITRPKKAINSQLFLLEKVTLLSKPLALTRFVG